MYAPRRLGRLVVVTGRYHKSIQLLRLRSARRAASSVWVKRERFGRANWCGGGQGMRAAQARPPVPPSTCGGGGGVGIS